VRRKIWTQIQNPKKLQKSAGTYTTRFGATSVADAVTKDSQAAKFLLDPRNSSPKSQKSRP